VPFESTKPMKSRIAIMLLITALLLAVIDPAISAADDFYVDKNGDNGNSGSEDDPWNTIQGAIHNSSIEDGDTIHVEAGTCDENILVDKAIVIYGQAPDIP
jgi:hypothetical protein